MANWLKYVIALASAFALMLAFRALVFPIHSVNGNGLAPLYQNGDMLLVNRATLQQTDALSCQTGRHRSIYGP